MDLLEVNIRSHEIWLRKRLNENFMRHAEIDDVYTDVALFSPFMSRLHNAMTFKLYRDAEGTDEPV